MSLHEWPQNIESWMQDKERDEEEGNFRSVKHQIRSGHREINPIVKAEREREDEGRDEEEGNFRPVNHQILFKHCEIEPIVKEEREREDKERDEEKGNFRSANHQIRSEHREINPIVKEERGRDDEERDEEGDNFRAANRQIRSEHREIEPIVKEERGPDDKGRDEEEGNYFRPANRQIHSEQREIEPIAEEEEEGGGKKEGRDEEEGSFRPVNPQICFEHREINPTVEEARLGQKEEGRDEKEDNFGPVNHQILFEQREIEPIAEGGQKEEQDEEQQRVEQGEELNEREEEPVSMKKRLVDMLTKIGDSSMTSLGMRLCRSCALERSPDNPDLVWEMVLGEGTYGRVSLVFHNEGVFAMKELTEAAGENEQFAAKCEMETMISIGYHNNVVRVYAVDDEIAAMPILMEAAVGDFRAAIKTSRFDFDQEATLLLDAAQGLAHVHSCGKVYGDIKPSNIVLVPDKASPTTKISFTAKIADFGFTVDAGEMTTIGTRGYGAPELLFEDAEAQPEMDVFSFGGTLLETFARAELARCPMFSHPLILTNAEKTAIDDIVLAQPDNPYAAHFLEDLAMKRALDDGSFERIMLVPNNLRPDVPYPGMVCDLLRRCLSPEQADRPTMQQVVHDLAFLCREPA